MQIKARIAAVAVAAVAVAGLVTPAQAAEGSTTDQRDQLIAFLTQYDVPAETQEELLGTLESGEGWDSFTNGPVVSVEQVPAAGETTEVTRFADGSVAVTSLEQGVVVPDGVIAPRAVSGCSVWQDGLMRRKTNCTVSHSTGVISMSFKADYNQQFSAQDLAYATYGRIMAVRDAHINTFGGTYTVRNFGRTQIQATASSPAKARLTIDVQGAGGWFGGTAWLQLNVPMNTYTLGYSTHQY